MSSGDRTLLIGLDGATWDVLNPLIQDGTLPNIKRIIEEGVSGELRSIIPPVTGPSWLAMAAGLNPGKIGVFDFIKTDKDDFALSPITSNDFKGKALWDILIKENKRSCILNFPMLYPPYEINGVMLCGLGCEDSKNMSCPRGYFESVIKKLGDYKLKVPYNLPKYINNEYLFFHDVEKILKQYQEVLSKILENEKFDLLFFIFSVTDFVLHYTWKYWDKSHFAYRDDSKIQEMIRQFWEKIDSLIGYIYGYSIKNHSRLLLVSDHGFGKQDEIFRINSWLIQKGFLKLKRRRAILETIKKKIGMIVKKVDKIFGKDFYTQMKSTVGINKSDFFKQFNLKKSSAIAGIHSDVVSGIYIIGSSDREKVKNNILHEIKEEESIVNIKTNALLSTEIYSGRYTAGAPDILLYIDDFRCSMNATDLNQNYYEANRNLYPNKSGTHRLNGIFVAVGPGIRKDTRLNSASILDICPTVLYLMGAKIPYHLDGKVLKDIFTDDFVKENEAVFFINEEVKTDDKCHSDSKKIIKNLESLGYM